MEATGAESPVQVLACLALLANSCAPFGTSLLGRGSCCPCGQYSTPLHGRWLLQGAPGHPARGQSRSGTQGAFADIHTWTKRGAAGLGHLYILFLILPFLERAPRPKAPRCSSWAWRRLRAESCLRPPRCRKRIFWALRLCFRICCLVLSSERTRPAGAPGARGWGAPAGTGVQGAHSAFVLTFNVSSSQKPPDCPPPPVPLLCSLLWPRPLA